MATKIFYSVETTGVNAHRHSIHRLAGFIEKDGTTVDYFDITSKPHPKADIDVLALRVSGVSKEQVLQYQDMKMAHKEFVQALSPYIDKYDRKDKAYLVGWNNRGFDDIFLRAWFTQCEDEFFGSLFWSDSIDTLVLASQLLIGQRPHLPNFQLKTVAKHLGIMVNEELLTDTLYKADLIRTIYRTVTL